MPNENITPPYIVRLKSNLNCQTPALASLNGSAQSTDQLRKRQIEAHRDFEIALDSVVEALAKARPAKATTVSTLGTLCGATLARTSRRVGFEAKERRELARMLLLGAILNHDNPNWNPSNASTDLANRQDPLFTLLQMDLTR